ncbi:MAG: hypothetical protein IT371_11450 [Deltaproteobacteria bacterium]|nr:hypothetical protein [Deltaproteobacteria bacterium]
MRSSTFRAWFAALGLACAACSDGGGPAGPDGGGQADAGPAAYGLPCAKDEDCGSKLCVDKFCSRACRKQAECPPVRSDPNPSKRAGTLGGPCDPKDKSCGPGLVCVANECLRAFDCGEVEPGKTSCYARRYDSRPYTMGHDCSIDGRCAQSYKCMGVPGDTERYCAPACKTDQDCPAAFRCASAQTGNRPAEKRCMRRQFGHPCAVEDQCGDAANLCIADVNQKKYCSKACVKGGNTCPPFATCEDVGNGKLQCRHKAGYAFKPEAKLCEPCVAHYTLPEGNTEFTVAEEGGCVAGGFCLRLNSYSREDYCATPCDAEGKCPDGYSCGKFSSLGENTKLCMKTKPLPEDPTRKTLDTCFP